MTAQPPAFLPPLPEVVRLYAACADAGNERWFPLKETGSGTRAAAQAKAICNTCPCRQACLDYAVANHIKHGIWGGLAPKEGRRITVAPRGRPGGQGLPAIKHGTPGGWRAHKYRKQRPCEACTVAHRDHRRAAMATWRAKKKVA